MGCGLGDEHDRERAEHRHPDSAGVPGRRAVTHPGSDDPVEADPGDLEGQRRNRGRIASAGRVEEEPNTEVQERPCDTHYDAEAQRRSQHRQKAARAVAKSRPHPSQPRRHQRSPQRLPRFAHSQADSNIDGPRHGEGHEEPGAGKDELAAVDEDGNRDRRPDDEHPPAPDEEAGQNERQPHPRHHTGLVFRSRTGEATFVVALVQAIGYERDDRNPEGDTHATSEKPCDRDPRAGEEGDRPCDPGSPRGSRKEDTSSPPPASRPGAPAEAAWRPSSQGVVAPRRWTPLRPDP